jgi:hypothetical protein
MEVTRRHVLKCGAVLTTAGLAGDQNRQAPAIRTQRDYIGPVRAHLDKILDKGTDVYGPEKTPAWMASLDTRTGTYPERFPKAQAGQRVYRDIAAPRGSSMYWDQPQVVAAYNLTRICGEPRYAKGADDYVRWFLRTGIDKNGMFEWGNHRYYDSYTDKVVHFAGGPHEMRPIGGAWDMFWRISPEATEREIRQAGKRHVFDEVTGGFNRHDDQKTGCAFLEAGGILADSLCWLAQKTGDRTLADRALLIAKFNFNYRDPQTGLIENDPTVERWDKYGSTTELGAWAGSLLRAYERSGVKEFANMAETALKTWLRFGYDAQTHQYYGQLRVKDGAPVFSKTGLPSADDYYPGNYANIWNAMFPTHDYPMCMAESCLSIYRRTKAPEFEEAVRRWARVVKDHPAPTTAKGGLGAYAELFGRAIHFLTGAGQWLKEPEYTTLAHKLAVDSVDILFADGMFRSHAGEDRYDSVDGVGYLLLSLFYLQAGKRPDYMGLGF